MSDKYDVEYAKDPFYGNEFNEFINLTVKFAGFNHELPFTAMETDPLEHGRLLYRNAKAGLYGEIQPFQYPVNRQALIDQAKEKRKLLESAFSKLQAYGLTPEEIAILTNNEKFIEKPKVLDTSGGTFPSNVPGYVFDDGRDPIKPNVPSASRLPPSIISAKTLSEANKKLKETSYLISPEIQALLEPKSAEAAREYVKTITKVITKAQAAMEAKEPYEVDLPELHVKFKTGA